MHTKFLSKVCFSSLLTMMLVGCESAEQIKEQLTTSKYCYDYPEMFSESGPLAGEQAPETDANGDRILWLNPSRVRRLLLQGNSSLLVGAIRVDQAKKAVNLARANLFPSLNLNMLVGSITNPSFLVDSVEYFLPFLVPTYWAQHAEAKDAYNAEKMSFLIADLNAFASAYAVFEKMDADYEGMDSLKEDQQDALLLHRLVSENYAAGLSTSGDLNKAVESLKKVEISIEQMNQFLIQENEDLRASLGVCPGIRLGIEKHHLPPSLVETLPIELANKKAKDRAPEMVQLVYLLEEAAPNDWQADFAFISDISAYSNASGTSSANLAGIVSTNPQIDLSYKNLKAKGSLVNLGLGYFRNLELVHGSGRIFQAQAQGTKIEIERLLDRNLKTIRSLEEEIAASKIGEESAHQDFIDNQKRYAEGTVDLNTLVIVEETWRQARLQTISSISKMDTARITFHRLMRTEEFEKVTGCWTELQVASGKLEGPCDETAIKRKLGIK
ncbi:MAG: outer membrane protein [Bacteriovoracaceae bacterium]|nr:outer membrane protein [Bacteriovoracaceae bacterium]